MSRESCYYPVDLLPIDIETMNIDGDRSGSFRKYSNHRSSAFTRNTCAPQDDLAVDASIN
jgi:hypothetical protein